MTCRVIMSWAEVGNTVPYPPFKNENRDNRGFSDLRGKPVEAAAIAECQDSDELKHWLISLARIGSPLFSLGCDIGARQYRRSSLHRFGTGGYVQLLATNYASRNVEDYKSLSERLATKARLTAKLEKWEVAFLLQLVQLNLDGYADEVVSLNVEFNARAASPASAVASRERLILVLRQACVTDPIFGLLPH